MKKILLSLLTIGLVVSATAGATRANFSDTETSTGNTFTAGTLDLNADGNNGVNDLKFTVTGLVPGNQPIYTWHLNNVGSIPGYLDLASLVITSDENTCTDPEVGDITCADPGAGELAQALGLDMIFDADCDGWFDAEDTKFYSGNASGVASSYELNKLIPAGGSVCLTTQFNWWSNRFIDDDLAQGDDLTMDMIFELGQTAAQ